MKRTITISELKNSGINSWRVTYKQNGKENDYGCFSKQEMIYDYLKILHRPFTDDISELKIWKGDTDYTGTLNKFLMK